MVRGHAYRVTHLRRAIEYSLLLRWVTLQTWNMTTLDMLVVLPISFWRSNTNNFWCRSETNQYQDLGEWICIQIVPHIWFSIFDGRKVPYVWWLELVNHHVGPVVDRSCSHYVFFVHLCRTIEYILLLGWVTIQTWPLTTLDMLVFLPMSFRRSYANNFWCHLETNQSKGPPINRSAWT